MSEIAKNLNFYRQMGAKTLLRWNKNYFDWLEKYLGAPSEYGANLKIAWSRGNRKIIYFPQQLMIQLHEGIDEKGIYWKLIETKEYPTEKQIEFYSNWLKENEQ